MAHNFFTSLIGHATHISLASRIGLMGQAIYLISSPHGMSFSNKDFFFSFFLFFENEKDTYIYDGIGGIIFSFK